MEADCGWDEYYPGRITKINDDGTVNITFNDGEKEKNVREDQIKSRDENDSTTKATAGVKRKGTKVPKNNKKTDTGSSSPFEKPRKKKSKRQSKSTKSDEEKSIELALKLMQSDYY